MKGENFHKWALGNLLENTTRGLLTEFIVASALELTDEARKEWDAVYILVPGGPNIEVK